MNGQRFSWIRGPPGVMGPLPSIIMSVAARWSHVFGSFCNSASRRSTPRQWCFAGTRWMRPALYRYLESDHLAQPWRAPHPSRVLLGRPCGSWIGRRGGDRCGAGPQTLPCASRRIRRDLVLAGDRLFQAQTAGQRPGLHRRLSSYALQNPATASSRLVAKPSKVSITIGKQAGFSETP